MRIAHDQPAPLQNVSPQCVLHRGPIKSGHLRSGSRSVRSVSRKPPANLSLFSAGDRAGKATMVQSPGGVGKEKMGPILPRPARRGDRYLGQDGAQGTFDETRRTGYLPVGPLWVRASRFVSLIVGWGGPGLIKWPHALRHVVNHQQPIEIKNNIRNKTKHRPTAYGAYGTAQAHTWHTRHRTTPRAAARRRLTLYSTPRRVSAGIQFLRATPLRCPTVYTTDVVPPIPSDGQHLTQMRVCVSGPNRGHGSRATREFEGPDAFWGPLVPGQVGLVGPALLTTVESCYNNVNAHYVGTNPFQPDVHMPPLVRCACFGCMTDRQIGKG